MLRDDSMMVEGDENTKRLVNSAKIVLGESPLRK